MSNRINWMGFLEGCQRMYGFFEHILELGISASQEHAIIVIPSETGSGLDENFMSVEAYVEEAGSLGDADTDHQTEESTVGPHFFPLGRWRGVFFWSCGRLVYVASEKLVFATFIAEVVTETLITNQPLVVARISLISRIHIPLIATIVVIVLWWIVRGVVSGPVVPRICTFADLRCIVNRVTFLMRLIISGYRSLSRLFPCIKPRG